MHHEIAPFELGDFFGRESLESHFLLRSSLPEPAEDLVLGKECRPGRGEDKSAVERLREEYGCFTILSLFRCLFLFFQQLLQPFCLFFCIAREEYIETFRRQSSDLLFETTNAPVEGRLACAAEFHGAVGRVDVRMEYAGERFHPFAQLVPVEEIFFRLQSQLIDLRRRQRLFFNEYRGSGLQVFKKRYPVFCLRCSPIFLTLHLQVRHDACLLQISDRSLGKHLKFPDRFHPVSPEFDSYRMVSDKRIDI